MESGENSICAITTREKDDGDWCALSTHPHSVKDIFLPRCLFSFLPLIVLPKGIYLSLRRDDTLIRRSIRKRVSPSSLIFALPNSLPQPIKSAKIQPLNSQNQLLTFISESKIQTSFPQQRTFNNSIRKITPYSSTPIQTHHPNPIPPPLHLPISHPSPTPPTTAPSILSKKP